MSKQTKVGADQLAAPTGNGRAGRHAASDAGQIVAVFQGGGALGAYSSARHNQSFVTFHVIDFRHRIALFEVIRFGQWRLHRDIWNGLPG